LKTDIYTGVDTTNEQFYQT